MNKYWSRDWYLEFSDALTANINSRQDCLGLILVGSTSDTSRVDEWSDHDFFVVAAEGAGENLRQDLSWLPYADEIAWSPRETAHGLKVVYKFGHVLEFAVFNDSELELAKVNAATVTVDKSNIAERVAAMRTASEPVEPNWDAELELLLTHILIGVGRARRGETMIAGQHTRSYLLGHLLGLLEHWLPGNPASASSVDNLNRFRRFEKRQADLAVQIETALQSDIEAGSREVLEILEATDPNSNNPANLGNRAKYQVVRDRLGWN
jgi:hypothetical protein